MATRKHFLRAIVFGNVKKVQKLLKAPGFNKANVKFGGVLITLAIRHKHLEIAKLLINNQAKVKKRKNYWMTMLLMNAARSGDIKLVKILVRAGANVNGRSRNGHTALHLAATGGNNNIVKYLLRHGADPSVKRKSTKFSGFTPLHYACYTRKIKCVKTLVKYSNDEVNLTDSEAAHPIQLSVAFNIKDITAFLVNYVDDINQRFTKNIYNYLFIFGPPVDECPTLLHWAVTIRSIDTVKLLLNNGANVNVKTLESNITPLMMAAQKIDLELLSIILNHNPDVNDVDRLGNTALHYLLYYEDAHQSRYSTTEFALHDVKVGAIELLVKAKADVDAKFTCENLPNLSSALDLAIYFGYWKAVRYFLYRTVVGFRQIDYSKIELAAFDENAIDGRIENDIDYINERKKAAQMTQSFLATYVFNRHTLGLHATEYTLINIDALFSIEEEENRFRKSLYTKEKEFMMQSFELLKNETVGESEISYWDLITKTPESMVKLAFDESFSLDGFDTMSSNKLFYYYVEIFLYKFNYIDEKSRALGKVIEILYDLFKSVLPYDCCEAIAYVMTNDELKSLIKMFDPLDVEYSNI